MNKIFKTAFFQIFCILFFTCVYTIFSDHFSFEDQNQKDKIIDYLLLSTTIQCSVGISGLNPTSTIGKIILIIHQLSVLFLHILTIYILGF
jgi:hypothetical protein